MFDDNPLIYRHVGNFIGQAGSALTACFSPATCPDKLWRRNTVICSQKECSFKLSGIMQSNCSI